VPTTTIPATFSFTRNISFNQPVSNNADDVKYLEQFLNVFNSEKLATDGIYGADDNEAMKRFQLKYKREILDVWSLTEATGYVGITTRLKMNFLLKGQTAICPAFTEYNGGVSGIRQSAEIGKTQQILKDLSMYAGPINNTWDAATNQALITFQQTFHEVMLDPWNLTTGTGYKYKTTNKFLNYFAGCDTGAVYLEGVGNYEGI
jgi:peptidoglycan hydrolase-like protein with peptidoglycan-binding domain